MPRNPSPRAVWEAAAVAGLSVDEYRQSDAYRDGLRDGTVEDPPSTGPNVDSGLVDGDLTVDPDLVQPSQPAVAEPVEAAPVEAPAEPSPAE